MERYITYKQTGVEWFEEIPEDWEVKKLGYLADVKRGAGYQLLEITDEGGEELIRISDFSDSDIKKVISRKELDLFRVNAGDILIAGTGATAGMSMLVPPKFDKMVHSYNSLRITSHDANSEFIYYCLQSSQIKEQMNLAFTGSAQPFLDIRRISDFLIAIPKSKQEQEQIRKYIDKKTIQVNYIINQKELLVEKLQAKRQAIINEAVTKGLHANVPMIPSGVEWLGDIPEHWEIKQVRYLLDPFEGIKIGPFGSALKLDMMVENGPYKVFGQENVIYDDFSIGTRFISEEKFTELANYKIEEGDILITMMGTTGKSKVVPKNTQVGIMDSHLIRLKPSNKIDPSFLSYLINDSYYILTQIQQLSRGAIMSGLNSKIIKSLFVLLPPLKEQKELLNNIKERVEIISRCENSIKIQIEKLIAYRQSLITEVVTGKIKVV